jgi:arylsulfatase A-like enzyme/sucrose-6-phosphate hydrolase SacC (GH32 family)
MHSKWDGGHGGLEIWQASTKDLRTWTHHPVTIPITEQWEAWNGTGAVAYLDGKYHWFYPTPHYEGQHNGIQHAVSTDGVHFEKQEPHPFLQGGDCEVFRTPDGVFHMVKAGPVRQAATKPVRDKTFVAWVALKDLEQQGGSVLTIEAPDRAQFDALVFGERVARRWMGGSNRHLRSSPGNLQQNWPEETAKPDEVVQVALVYQGNQGTLYRNEKVYGRYEIPQPMTFPTGSSLMIGWRHTGGGPAERAYFRGRVLDARLYDQPLSAEELEQLRPDVPGGPEPSAWYDFENGSLRDRSGTYPDAKLFGKARIEDGALVLDGQGDYLKASGTVQTQVRLTSNDLENWTPVDGSFIESDKRLATCPNVFRFGDWHYYICGSGVWRSKEPFGPWQEHSPLRLDNLAVPKTAAFGTNRRIYAGFLGDGGWGGNSVLRELVQDSKGCLGTRFVPELIPASGDPLPIRFEPRPPRTESNTVRVVAGQPGSISIPNVPGDYRLRMDIEAGPEALESSFGIGLCTTSATGEDGCDLVFEPGPGRVRFSKMGDSSGAVRSGPAIESVEGMNRPFTVDIIVRHDILDAEIGGFRAVTTRFWNPRANRIRLFAEAGTVTFRNIRVQPLTDIYEPYPGWRQARENADPLALNYHLMHPGGPSGPGDPNAAFYLDGTYHLHYILRHPWNGKRSFSFVHVTSPDMLHWTWQPTKLQPSFTGHGMFSGTGLLTTDGRPAAIYHGQASGRNQIAIAKNRKLTAWEKPYPVEVKMPDGSEPDMRHWDPDCFLIGDTYYAISGGQDPPVFKSKDLKRWTYIGPFLSEEPPNVVKGEDISCANFFPIGDKWMLLCISHPLGCRYYLGDWDAEAEQFVPETMQRMTWPWEGGDPDNRFSRALFAPESVLTPDGRRVMWAWMPEINDTLRHKTLQCLPRELILADDGSLRIRPLRELESHRYDPVVIEDFTVESPDRMNGGFARKRVAELNGDAFEIRVTVPRAEADRKYFGVRLFAGEDRQGLPINIQPANGTLRVGTAEAPFAVADLPPGEDVELRIFIDKYLVEVFVNGRQTLVAADMDYTQASGLDAFTWGADTTFKKFEIWRLQPTNQGYFEAKQNKVWQPDEGASTANAISGAKRPMAKSNNHSTEAARSRQRPDVLFIAIDDMNDWTTLFDPANPIRTPHLERLAARGAFFTNAYCAAPGCNPSRTAIMTGLRPSTSGVYENKHPWRAALPEAVTLSKYFEQHGYCTRGAGKIFHHGKTGADDPANPSFQEFFAMRPSPQPKIRKGAFGCFDWGPVTEPLTDEFTVQWATGQMADVPRDKPLFLAAGIFHPHLPHFAPLAFFDRYPFEKTVLPPMPPDDLDDVPPIGIELARKEWDLWKGYLFDDPPPDDDPASLKSLVRAYQASASYADAKVGQLLDQLDATGRAENTIIVLWSDHGYHLGDKQSVVKFTLWEKANHVPFIIVAPGVTRPGTRIDAPVSLVNIYATLAELAGLPAKEGIDSQSLVPLLKNPNAKWKRPALMTQGRGNHAVRSRDWRYIRYSDGTEELYDCLNDSLWNHTNLLAGKDKNKFAAIVAEHRRWLPKTEASEVPPVSRKISTK